MASRLFLWLRMWNDAAAVVAVGVSVGIDEAEDGIEPVAVLVDPVTTNI